MSFTIIFTTTITISTSVIPTFPGRTPERKGINIIQVEDCTKGRGRPPWWWGNESRPVTTTNIPSLGIFWASIAPLRKSNRRPVAIGVRVGFWSYDELLLLSLLLILTSLFLVFQERVAVEVIIILESELLSNNKGRAQPNGSLKLTTLPPLISASSSSPLLLEVLFIGIGTTATSGCNELLIWLVSSK